MVVDPVRGSEAGHDPLDRLRLPIVPVEPRTEFAEALLRRLRGGLHTLRFQVDEGPEANGVAIFGREAELNREPVDEPGSLQLLADHPLATARP